MAIRKYWQLSLNALPAGADVFNEFALTGPAELLARVSARDGIVLASWDQSALLGRVSALGVITKARPTAANVDWREVDLQLRPNPSGRVHWRTKQSFAFAKDVVVRYMLADLFADRFPDLEGMEFTANIPGTAGASRRLPTVATPGYVYVIHSQYGYKIGKTVNLKTRTKLFEVKLPFPVKLEHYAWFDNYSVAERDFHEMFREQRLEGEWFDLKPADLARIRTFGKQVTVEALR